MNTNVKIEHVTENAKIKKKNRWPKHISLVVLRAICLVCKSLCLTLEIGKLIRVAFTFGWLRSTIDFLICVGA